MSNKFDDLQEVLDELVDSLGTVNVTNILNLFRAEKYDRIDIINQFIIYNVAQKMGISVHEIKHGKNLDANIGRMVCFSLMKKHNDLSLQQIADIFKKSKNAVYNQMKNAEHVFSLKFMTNSNIKIITIHNEVDTKVENLLIGLKTIDNE